MPRKRKPLVEVGVPEGSVQIDPTPKTPRVRKKRDKPATTADRITPGRRGGRETKYSQALDDIARDILANGGTLDDIAKKFGCDRTSIHHWRRKYESFDAALRMGREIIGEVVEQKYLDLALGGIEVTETTYEEGPKGILQKKVTKTLAPSEPALKFWLVNRKNSDWKEKPDVGAAENSAEAIKKWIEIASPSSETMEELFSDIEEEDADPEALIIDDDDEDDE